MRASEVQTRKAASGRRFFQVLAVFFPSVVCVLCVCVCVVCVRAFPFFSSLPLPTQSKRGRKARPLLLTLRRVCVWLWCALCCVHKKERRKGRRKRQRPQGKAKKKISKRKNTSKRATRQSRKNTRQKNPRNTTSQRKSRNEANAFAARSPHTKPYNQQCSGMCILKGY